MPDSDKKITIPAPGVAKMQQDNPLMERFNKMPPETFRMPSGGSLYTNGEISDDVVDGEIIIYPMTTVDELTMRSPDMLFQGTAIENVFKRCMPQVKKPRDLMSNDVDYLLICLRMVTYGETIDIYWECPECKSGAEEIRTEQVRDEVFGENGAENPESKKFVNVKPTYSIKLNDFLRKSRPLDVDDEDLFTVKLTTGEVVRLHPSTFGDMLKLYQWDSTKLETPEEMTEFIVDGLMAVIQSVNNVTEPAHIKEWGGRCEAPVLDQLQTEIHKINDWGTSEKYDFACVDCGHKSSVEIPLNPVHFFTAPSTGQTKP
jgi:hypothetical protein